MITRFPFSQSEQFVNDPTKVVTKRPDANRRGAIMPLFALILPVLFILSGFAINLAYMQLVSTELKIATDAAAHAGGRAMSIHQTTQDAVEHAQSTALLNNVGGKPLALSTNSSVMKFGLSTRDEGGYGQYQFNEVPRSQVDNGTQRATSLAVISDVQIPMVFGAMPGVSQIAASRRSIATQVDRDIALVLDKSGSMQEYKDYDYKKDTLRSLYYAGDIDYYEYRNGYRYNSFSYNTLTHLNGDLYEFAYDRRYHSGRAARHSRWFYLDLAVEAFLDVLDVTDQEEQVSLVTFSSYAYLNEELLKDYTPIRNRVNNINPSGATAIGKGLQTGLPPIINGPNARTFAAKTIVVLTDGINNRNPDPEDAVRGIVLGNNVTIHTVTFTPGADQTAMKEVARLGGGRHYHANDGGTLVEIFEEIANNLPTILTE